MIGMTAGHFLFIPAVLLVGIVIGWILGSRAAKDAYASELRKRAARSPEQGVTRQGPPAPRDAGGGPGVLG